MFTKIKNYILKAFSIENQEEKKERESLEKKLNDQLESTVKPLYKRVNMSYVMVNGHKISMTKTLDINRLKEIADSFESTVYLCMQNSLTRLHMNNIAYINFEILEEEKKEDEKKE